MGKKLIVYLIDGTDNGPRTVEIGNWSGKAIHSPRASLRELMVRGEFSKPGIYILKSDPIEDFYSEKIYIGEAENIGKRLKQHLQNSEKDFKECIFFISKDELLTKSHIKYIESRLVSLAKEAKNSEIENNNNPTESALSEADISDMEEFIRQIKLILPATGYTFLINSQKPSNDITKKPDKIYDNIIFNLKTKNNNAKMIVTDEGFLVLKGSQVDSKATKSVSKGWLKLREKLIHNKTLVAEGKIFVFVEDYLFSSPSAAASVLLGRQAPGPLVWINDDGKTYKDYEIEKLKN